MCLSQILRSFLLTGTGEIRSKLFTWTASPETITWRCRFHLQRSRYFDIVRYKLILFSHWTNENRRLKFLFSYEFYLRTPKRVSSKCYFLIDNILFDLIDFGGLIHEETDGIPLGMNCQYYWTTILYSYEAEFIQRIPKTKNIYQSFNFTFLVTQ